MAWSVVAAGAALDCAKAGTLIKQLKATSHMVEIDFIQTSSWMMGFRA
jgi:hypothetical protein